MARTDDSSGKTGSSRAARVAVWCAVVVILTSMMLLACVGLLVVLGRLGAATDWSIWGNVGQAFGLLSAVISGLTLVVVVITSRAQFRELQQNRREREEQRQLLTQSRSELRRTAEANGGRLHLEILKLAIDDPQLAEVWPPFQPGLSIKQNRQYLYANIIYQFQQTWMRVAGHTEEEVLGVMRYLFRSPIMRDYWRAAGRARASLIPDSEEFLLAQKVDELWHEYEAVIAARRDPAFGSVMDFRPPDHRDDGLDSPGNGAGSADAA